MAAAPQKLARFAFSESEEGYVLHIEAESGDRLDLDATPEQLDAIIDALDDLLSEDDGELFAVEAGDEDEDVVDDGDADGDEDRANA